MEARSAEPSGVTDAENGGATEPEAPARATTDIATHKQSAGRKAVGRCGIRDTGTIVPGAPGE